jgi:hypothetical protein
MQRYRRSNASFDSLDNALADGRRTDRTNRHWALRFFHAQALLTQPDRAVGTVEEPHATMRVGAAGRRHRIDHDRCLPSLKFVLGSDTGAGDAFLKLEHLRVIGRNDQDVLQPVPRFNAVAVNPCRPVCQNFTDEVANLFRLLPARALIALVFDRQAAKSRDG